MTENPGTTMLDAENPMNYVLRVRLNLTRTVCFLIEDIGRNVTVAIFISKLLSDS